MITRRMRPAISKKAIPILIVGIFCALIVVGCKGGNTTGQTNESYREVTREDGINYFAKMKGQTYRGGHFHDIGYEFFLIGHDGKEIAVPLLSDTVEDGQIQTRDFGVLKAKENSGMSFQLFATESQIRKLRALQLSGQ